MDSSHFFLYGTRSVRRLLRHVLLSLAFGVAGFLSASDGSKPAVNSPSESVQNLIAQLESDDFTVREKAQLELFKIGAPAVEPLKKILAERKDATPEFRQRAQRILDLYDGGGEPANGLKLKLAVDKTAVKPGDSVTFTMMLGNLTERRLNVQVGYSTCGNYFECGKAFRCVEAPEREGGNAVLQAPTCTALFCGTGAGSLFITLNPYSSVQFKAQAALRETNEKQAQANGLSYGFRYYQITASRAAHRLCVELANSGPYEHENGEGTPPADEKASFWSGTIHSNELALEVLSKESR